MAEIKGKFVMLATSFLSTKPHTQAKAIASVRFLAGKVPKDLDPEAFYDTSILDAVFRAVKEQENEIMARAALKTIGMEVYYEIKNSVGLPDHLKTPVDFICFTSEGFRVNHRGADVIQRKVIEAREGKVVMEAPSPGYDCTWIEGVYLGILRMCGHMKTARVVQTKCVQKGDTTCIYDITW